MNLRLKTVRVCGLFFFARQCDKICAKMSCIEGILMKYIRIFLLAITMPFAAHAASNEFMVAAQLLSAAKNADIQQVQALISNGANVNYVDSTGLSLVCTALMNKDYRAAQILQMYGADASQCDRQIKQYNSRTRPVESGGLFGGLSSAQTLTLAAAGAAVVIGGVLWLSGVFDSSNNNISGGGGTRPGGSDGDGNGSVSSAIWFDPLPYGPAMPNAESEVENFAKNINLYNPTDDETSQMYLNFQKMTVGTSANPGQNYLLMMNGYAPLARGYLGMQTLRVVATHTPISVNGIKLFNTEQVLGGRPVNVALITDNGINAADGTSLQNGYLAWVARDGLNSVGNASAGSVSSKYYNNTVSATGTNTWDDGFSSIEADSISGAQFDLSGFGTAINNGLATDYDNLLAKVVGGRTGGYSNDGDYIGFMPNGQMTIFRTGGGWTMVESTAATGSYTLAGAALAVGDTITITGDNGATYTVSAVNNAGNQFTASSSVPDAPTASGWVIAGSLYLDTNGDGRIDQVFSINSENKTLAQTMQGQAADYLNYRALRNSAKLITNPTADERRSAPGILANASVIDPLRDLFGAETRAATLDDMLAALGRDGATSDTVRATFGIYVNKFYGNSSDDDEGTSTTPAGDAISFFNGLGSTYSPLVLFSTGSFQTDSVWSGAALNATFENAAPLVFDNLEHLFMSVVAVGLTDSGTNNAGSKEIFGYAPSGKYALSKWSEGTGDNTKSFRARKCGVAGSGAGGIDPWCFAAAGITDELAVSSAAGAAGALFSAFGGENGYLSSGEIFVLMALTADGPYLGTDSAGNRFTEAGLISYLQSMYELPDEDEYRWRYGGENYLDVFKEVFGYGLINLKRATTPGTTIFYYNGKDIVSGSGNAYARAAAATRFRASAAFSPRAATISAPFYDVLESFDGEMSLPRVWRNEFALGAGGARGLYMGDTLGELKTRRATAPRAQIGKIGFSLTTSEKPYSDYLGGLDNIALDFATGNWNFKGQYQRHFTDGDSRFDGRGNPVLGLASNAIITDADYNFGKFSIGARAFSGIISDEGILENDPTIAAQYMPAELGRVRGGQSHVAWNGERLSVMTAFGTATETQTLLGAQTGGLLNLGSGDTTYIDAVLRYAPTARVALTLRSTFAHTTSNADGQFILGMSAIDSDAFSAGLDAGNFSFTVARPLAVRRGNLTYAHADYRVAEDADGNYDLDIAEMYTKNLNLAPEKREVRFTGTYRRQLGEFTDGALGFVYRVHPNNTDEFGNESIFMMKLTHRLGI